MPIDKINPKSEKNKTEKEFKIFKPEENTSSDQQESEDNLSSKFNSSLGDKKEENDDPSNQSDVGSKSSHNNGNNDDDNAPKSKTLKSNSNSKKCFIRRMFQLKNLAIFVGFIFVCYFSIRLFVKPSLNQYPKLDTCFVTSVFKINLCPSNPKYVKVNQVSKILIHSILISEDDSFYMHQGIDWNEFQKSFQQNLEQGRFVRGGSTITQQLVKNIYLTQDKSIFRKFKEILLAQQMEKKYSKSIILEKYLNVIELGYQIYGVKSAANYYFNKSPSQLNVLESLYLTMLLPNPKDYSSSFKNGRLTTFQKERIQTLLERLLRRKRISRELYTSAKSQINLFPWKNVDLNESNKLDDGDLDFINDKRIYLEDYQDTTKDIFNHSDPISNRGSNPRFDSTNNQDTQGTSYSEDVETNKNDIDKSSDSEQSFQNNSEDNTQDEAISPPDENSESVENQELEKTTIDEVPTPTSDPSTEQTQETAE